jgi:GMP synthase (glutamine-hydrolysing)
METILVIDFGSQYTQLIARRLRELNVYCEIRPYYALPPLHDTAAHAHIKGVILAGSPHSTHDANAPQINLDFIHHYPTLGVCYGAQLIASTLGGTVVGSQIREYGRAILQHIDQKNVLFQDINPLTQNQVWMSHGDTISALPPQATGIASTDTVQYAAYQLHGLSVFGVQFHPEVTHSLMGMQLLKNFVVSICGCQQTFTPDHFIHTTIATLKAQIGTDKVIMGLSGGVDSTVAAVLLHQAIGDALHCIFVDNGLLRHNEYAQVLQLYTTMGLNVVGINAQKEFYDALHLCTDPEQKRKAVGKTFIEVFDAAAQQIQDARWLGQGTIYPDVIESVAIHGTSATIKSHHNVGGLPDNMQLRVVEPLKTLFKDEVRRVGKALGISDDILGRHPFPGPGLAIRILGDVTPQKIAMVQQADFIFIDLLKKHGLYNQVWQAGAIFLPVQSVGVMGDERTYENAICLRAVESTDGMTADWCGLPHDFLRLVSNEIINKVKGINRVVYDISSKPPATIEWE